jgi:hypothetical protein
MPQTMLAFLAMTMAIYMSLNQQKADLHTVESIIDSEYEILANAVALEQMEIIAASVDWADLDGLNGTEVTRAFSFNTFQESFDLSIGVQFVDASGNLSAIPTTMKEVSISAFNDRYTLPLVTHARLISD